MTVIWKFLHCTSCGIPNRIRVTVYDNSTIRVRVIASKFENDTGIIGPRERVPPLQCVFCGTRLRGLHEAVYPE